MRRAIWLAIVPDGTNRAASLPVISAKVSWRRLTVGSSPYWSSPTSASAIARRMAGVGRVTVSERRSTSTGPPYGTTGVLTGPRSLSVAEVFGVPPAGQDPLLAELAAVALACAHAAG